MLAQQEPMIGFNEAVRSVAGTMIWMSKPASLSIADRQDQMLVKEYTRSLRLRAANLSNIPDIRETFREAIDTYPEDEEMDPDDIGVPALERGEGYFHKEREELHRVRRTLEEKGGEGEYGSEVFLELDRLDSLYRELVSLFQDLRWTILMHDGRMAESVGRIRGGQEFLKSLEEKWSRFSMNSVPANCRPVETWNHLDSILAPIQSD